jgi:hypothetical protein
MERKGRKGRKENLAFERFGFAVFADFAFIVVSVDRRG